MFRLIFTSLLMVLGCFSNNQAINNKSHPLFLNNISNYNYCEQDV